MTFLFNNFIFLNFYFLVVLLCGVYHFKFFHTKKSMTGFKKSLKKYYM